jgi:hypothetical protein
MLFLDLLAILAVFVIIGLYYLHIRNKVENQDGGHKKQGELNLKAVRQELNEKCLYCEGKTNPGVDVMFKGAWWHRTCFTKMIG